MAFALTPDGEHVFYSGLALFRARTSDGKLLDRTVLPFVPGMYRVSPNGHTLVAIEQSVGGAEQRIAIVDLRD